ncbi:MAG: hypothetical protein WCP08_00780 [Prolixibacteraceae bacterium]
MSKPDKLVIYKGKFYARKFDAEPMQKVHSFSSVSESNILPDSEIENSSYAVDWQMESIEIQLTNKNSVLDFSMRKLDSKRFVQDAMSKKNNSYILDW